MCFWSCENAPLFRTIILTAPSTLMHFFSQTADIFFKKPVSEKSCIYKLYVGNEDILVDNRPGDNVISLYPY